MNARTNHWIVAAAIVVLILGAILSRAVEPGVRVEKIMLTTNTPALRIFPATPGPHPTALLAHGNGGSKEMLFRYGEALAAAGFDCYSVDAAGHGESPQACTLTNLLRNFRELERALDPVDVFIGHSMGGGLGQWSVVEAGFRPRLFIGVGAPVKLGEHGPPLLLLGGLFEEFFRPAQLRARTDAQVVISPWCEHITEAYDPVLVRAAVQAACVTVGKPVPAAPTSWRWRFAGLVLGIAGALVLMFRLPEVHPRLARMRGFIVPGVLLIAVVLTWGTSVGVNPQLRRIPAHLVVLGVVWLALVGLRKLQRNLVATTSTSSQSSGLRNVTTWKSSLPGSSTKGLIRCFLRLGRGSLVVVSGIVALGCMAVGFATDIFPFFILMAIFGIGALLLLPSLAVGRIADRGGSRRDGDIAMAIFAGYVIGQFMPLFY
jgi:pimeloyl-ACP methyl ester carboxylesterase